MKKTLTVQERKDLKAEKAAKVSPPSHLLFTSPAPPSIHFDSNHPLYFSEVFKNHPPQSLFCPIPLLFFKSFPPC